MDSIADLSDSDILVVSIGAKVDATVVAAYTAGNGSGNSGTANLTTAGYAVDLSSADGTKGFGVINTGGATTLTGSPFSDTLVAGNGNDTLTGGAGSDILTGAAGANCLAGGAGNDTISGGAGNDTIDGADSADSIDGGADADTLRLSASYTSGTDASLTNVENVLIAGSSLTVNLSNQTESFNVTMGTGVGSTVLTLGNGNDTVTGNIGNDTLTGGAGNDILTGAAGADSLAGGAGNDTISGGAGNDILNGGTGTDSLIGGAGSDVFVFAAGDSGQTTGLDIISDFAKGAVGTGDLIDYASNLSLGGSAATATATAAAINQSTGIATFASGSGTTTSDALADIATRFTAATDTAGEFAFFRVNNTGNFYVFISDGVAGLGANDVVVQLTGVTSIAGINLTNGNLTITS